MATYKGIYILLAAGFSRRFGSSKLLYAFDSQNTVIASSISALKNSKCRFLVAVREDDEKLRAHLEYLNVKSINIKNAHMGMSNVIAECVSKLDTGDIDWLGIALADMPYIKPNTFSALSKCTSSESVIRPQYQGKLGHPVLFGKRFFPELCKLEGDDGAKSVLKHHPEALKVVEVDDSMICHDIDVPEDVI